MPATPRCPSPTPPSLALAQLLPPELERFDVFTVATPRFWRLYPKVLVGFFANLAAIGSTGLLIARRSTDCERAKSGYNISCAVSCHHPIDPMMSKEKWHVLKHFLSHGKAVAFAGADMRMLAPVRSMREACGDSSVDFAFDGRVANDRIQFFTPDFMIAFPTARARAFVDRLIRDVASSESSDADEHTRGVAAADVDGEANLKRLRTKIMSLAGPAEQDLLFDSFVSVLYDRELWARKRFVARDQLDLPPLLPMNESDEGRSPYSVDLPALPVRATRYGALVSTPRLRAFLTDDRMVREGRTRKGRPCDKCRSDSSWAATPPLALHCNGKLVACLDLSGCTCLSRGLRERIARHSALFESRRRSSDSSSSSSSRAARTTASIWEVLGHQ